MAEASFARNAHHLPFPRELLEARENACCPGHVAGAGRSRGAKLVLSIAVAIAVLVFGYYFYERAQELRLAEERAKAVGERVFEVRPDDAAAEGE
jgi:hypothetical protein